MPFPSSVSAADAAAIPTTDKWVAYQVGIFGTSLCGPKALESNTSGFTLETYFIVSRPEWAPEFRSVA
jgi:hypothetical protein